jgi:hypothetical protein
MSSQLRPGKGAVLLQELHQRLTAHDSYALMVLAPNARIGPRGSAEIGERLSCAPRLRHGKGGVASTNELGA